jgi:hypothetical protein
MNQMNEQTFTMRDLFARSFCRYVKVTPTGLQISPDRLLSTLTATVLTFRPARTRYQNRKPACRSLDGIQSVTTRRCCASCLLRRNCTPQICLDMLHENIPLRLLLAFTSARNFMQFVSQCQKRTQPVEDTDVLITVRDRGRWGEILFQIPTEPDPS